MRPPTQVLFSSRAFETIRNETIAHPALETGGLLVGRRVYYDNEPVLVVLYASGPGKKPDRNVLEYAPDHKALQQYLQEWRDHFKRYDVDYIGEWHKHPEGFAHPTDGDIRQARAILQDPSYNLLEGDLLLPITRLVNGGFRLGTFYMSRRVTRPLQLPHIVTDDEILLQFLDEYISLEKSTDQPEPTVRLPKLDFPEKPCPSPPPRPKAMRRVYRDDRIGHKSKVPPRYLVTSYKVIEDDTQPTKPICEEDVAKVVQDDGMPISPIQEGDVAKQVQDDTQPARPIQEGDPESQLSQQAHSGVQGSQIRISRDLKRLQELADRYGFSLKVLPTTLAPEGFELKFYRPITLSLALSRGKKARGIYIELGEHSIASSSIRLETDKDLYRIRPIHDQPETIDQLVEALIKWLRQEIAAPSALDLFRRMSGRNFIKEVIHDMAELLRMIEANIDRQAEASSPFEFLDD